MIIGNDTKFRYLTKLESRILITLQFAITCSDNQPIDDWHRDMVVVMACCKGWTNVITSNNVTRRSEYVARIILSLSLSLSFSAIENLVNHEDSATRKPRGNSPVQLGQERNRAE